MAEGKNNIVVAKSEDFAVRIVRLYQFLDSKEKVLAHQLLKSGTSIGANVAEAQNAQSEADFGTKMNVALKEAAETLYWLKLLYRTEYLNESQYQSIADDALELQKLLTSIVKAVFAKKLVN